MSQYYEDREDQLQTASQVLSSANSHVLTALKYRQTPDEFDNVINKQLMMDVVNIYTFRKEILETGEQPESAVRITLSTLDCKTTDEILTIADNLRFNQTIGDLMLKSVVKNQESRDALSAFVEESHTKPE